MIDLIQTLYQCTVLRFDEFDGEQSVFEVIQHGILIRADSLALLIAALAKPTDMRLAA